MKAVRLTIACNAEFLRRYAADEPLPKGVSVRIDRKLEYDAEAVLADAIAEGIDQRHQPPEACACA